MTPHLRQRILTNYSIYKERAGWIAHTLPSIHVGAGDLPAALRLSQPHYDRVEATARLLSVFDGTMLKGYRDEDDYLTAMTWLLRDDGEASN